MTEALDPLAILDGLVTSPRSAAETYSMLERTGLGDGLPVAETAAAQVDAMVRALGVAPDEILASVPPLRGALTARRLAVCAALAGCEPAHMPPIRSAVIALAAPELNALGVLTTTGSAALMVVVNGPARRTLRFNGATNCLGPGNRSNATVGRCLSLVTRVVGGARAGMADMATMGQPAKYTCCFAEHEEATPWEPLHVERGFAEHASTVTVIGIAGTLEVFESHSTDPRDMISSLAPTLAAAGPIVDARRSVVGGGQPMVLLSPEWAQLFAAAGMTKYDVKVGLFDTAVAPAEPPCHVAERAEDILVVVAGGVGVKQTIVPNWNGGSRAVTVGF